MSAFLSVDQRNLGSSSSISQTGFTLSAGSNRRLFICIGVESVTVAPTITAGPTFGGVTATRVTDGTTLARAQVGTDFNAMVDWFEILEADLPADGGGHSVTATLSATIDEGIVAVLVIQDASQAANVSDVTLFQVTGDTDPSYTITAPDDDSIILSAVACGNAVSFTHGTGQTERWDSTLASSGYTATTEEPTAAGDQVTSHTASGTINRSAAAGFAVADFVDERAISGTVTLAPVTTAGAVEVELEASGTVTTNPVTVDGTGSVLVNASGTVTLAPVTTSGLVLTIPRDISGTVTLGAVNTSGSLERGREISGTVTLGAVTVSGDADADIGISGTVTMGAIEATGDADVHVGISGTVTLAPVETTGNVATDQDADISGTVTLGAVQTSGTITVPVNISGTVQLGAVDVSGAAGVEVGISGSVTLGAIETTGAASRPREITGTITLGAATVSGAASVDVGISGTVTLGAVETSGEVVQPFPAPGSMRLTLAVLGSVRVTLAEHGSLSLRLSRVGSVTLAVVVST